MYKLVFFIIVLSILKFEKLKQVNCENLKNNYILTFLIV